MMWFLGACCALLIFGLVTYRTKKEVVPALHKPLRNGVLFPLVGFGVGNMPHDTIVANVGKALHSGYRLIDTANESKNSHLIRQAILSFRDDAKADPKALHSELRMHKHSDIHIVTKIWYTYLGYERTKMALEDIISDYEEMPGVKLHVLLHWPRCREDIEWMHCEEEENNLPLSVRRTGDPPHLLVDDDPPPFVGSWKAMEEAYRDPINPIVSIGVSNFDLKDLDTLETHASIIPHLLQDNVWNAIFNPHDHPDYCRKREMVYQGYNTMNGIIGQRERAPRAWEVLVKLSQSVTGSSDIEKGAHFVLLWLVQNDVAIIPRTERHISNNRPSALEESAEIVRTIDQTENATIVSALKALMSGRDLEQPKAVFVNRHVDTNVDIYWHSGESEVPTQLNLPPGEKFTARTSTGHRFVVYDTKNKDRRKEFLVSAVSGEEEFHIEL